MLIPDFPYNTNSSAAGRPPPDVSWYRGEERLAMTKEGSVSQLHIPSLSREMAGTRLQCRVDPPLMQPMFRDVTLKLYCKYLSCLCDGMEARFGMISRVL